MDIIYCDNHLLVLHKPAGILTQSMPGEPSLEEWGKNWLKEKFQKPGNVFLTPIHRLDRLASGLVLSARTSKALRKLEEEKKKGAFRKTYEALVEGTLSEDEGELEHYLVHEEYYARKGGVTESGSKLCRLRYRVVERMGGITRVSIDLETGRYHQIRAQFSLMGHPIVGDQKYGAKKEYKPQAIALCHVRMEIFHPILKQKITFSVDHTKT